MTTVASDVPDQGAVMGAGGWSTTGTPETFVTLCVLDVMEIGPGEW